MEYIQKETVIHIPKKHTEEPKLSNLSHKVCGELHSIHSSWAGGMAVLIKNTQILSMPEATRSSCNLWLDGHGDTGKKSERPWPKVSSRTWSQTLAHTRCIVKISVETQGHQKKNEDSKNKWPINQDEPPTGTKDGLISGKWAQSLGTTEEKRGMTGRAGQKLQSQND